MNKRRDTHLEEGDVITEALELMKNDKTVMKYGS